MSPRPLSPHSARHPGLCLRGQLLRAAQPALPRGGGVQGLLRPVSLQRHALRGGHEGHRDSGGPGVPGLDAEVAGSDQVNVLIVKQLSEDDLQVRRGGPGRGQVPGGPVSQ